MTTRSKLPPDPEPVLREAMHESWSEYLHWRKKLRKKPSQKAVHRLRVAIRRLSSRLDLLGEEIAPKPARRLLRRLGRELHCLRDVRDLQVQREKVFAGRPRPFLERGKYLRFLERETEKELARARKKLAKWGVSRNRKQLDELDRSLTSRLAGAGTSAREKLLAALRARLDDAIRSFERLEVDLRPGDHRTFHKLRICAKDLDYKGEMARALHPLPRSLASRLPRLRKRLGKLQDEVVFLKTSGPYLRKSGGHPHPRRELERKLVRKETALAAGA